VLLCRLSSCPSVVIPRPMQRMHALRPQAGDCRQPRKVDSVRASAPSSAFKRPVSANSTMALSGVVRTRSSRASAEPLASGMQLQGLLFGTSTRGRRMRHSRRSAGFDQNQCQAVQEGKSLSAYAPTLGDAMPYVSNADLLPSVRRSLPEHAQDIYREAFNHAFAAHVGDPRQEEAPHRIAWAAVKRSYLKTGNGWIVRGTDD